MPDRLARAYTSGGLTNMGNMVPTCTYATHHAGNHGGKHGRHDFHVPAMFFRSAAMFLTIFFKEKCR